MSPYDEILVSIKSNELACNKYFSLIFSCHIWKCSINQAGLESNMFTLLRRKELLKCCIIKSLDKQGKRK